MNDIDWFKMTERPEERELRRKLKRQALWEAACAILTAVVGVVLLLLYIAATPPQSSAINDLEAEDAGKEAQP